MIATVDSPASHRDLRPHLVKPRLGTARVVLTMKNFAKIRGVSHIGLGVTAINTAKTLRKHGVRAETWATQTSAELAARLAADVAAGGDPISHVVISAPSWVQPDDFAAMALDHPETEFVQLNHSGCAFLSIDKFGLRNIRQVLDLQRSAHNVRVAANNPRVAGWIAAAFGGPCLLLPNLYDVDSFVDPVPHRPVGHTLRIGSFGAGRPWKNQLVAAEAAVALARRLGVNLELHVNSKRPDGGERMIESRAELFAGLRGCTLVDVPWEPWPRFRATVATMNLLLQPSFDETFNVVTADGIAEGVASVTSTSIEWTPRRWWAETDDPADLVRVAIYLLSDPHAVDDGRQALRDYVTLGVARWLDHLVPGPRAA